VSFAMASVNCLGGRPELSADLTIIINRMGVSPCGFWLYFTRRMRGSEIDRLNVFFVSIC
jgi:hypothetical protein